jgi:hypothetical protein
MNMLHYLNVIIGFSLVMLLLSIVTSFAAQAWLVLFKTKARAVGNGLTRMLEDIGFEKSYAKLNVDALLDKGSSIFGERLGGILSSISAYFLAGAPKDIGREEFLLLLLRKASSDKALADKLGFQDEAGANRKLGELEKEMLVEETKDPSLPVQVWRTKAMQTTVPELASKIFARFDEVIDRVNDDVSAFGKILGIVITFPLLLIYWPVDSINLLNRLNNDQVLSEKLAEVAETNLPSFQKAHDEFLKCQENNKNNPDIKQTCEQSDQAIKKVVNDTINLGTVGGLFGNEVKKDLDCNIPFVKGCKRAELTSGIFVTWILVSLGSAFWLGLLNKMLGIRSEFSKKLDTQREFRSTSQG